jgi:hypothetical protein
MSLMGQILLWRRLGSKANLSNLNLDYLFSFSEANLIAKDKNTMLQVAARQIGCDICNENDIKVAETEIRNHPNSWMMVRGKYALWFFVKQCEAIWKTIPKLFPRFQDKPNKKIEYTIKNAIIILDPRMRTPKSLKEFIEQNYLSFIHEVGQS